MNLAQEFIALATNVTVLPEKHGRPMKWSGAAVAELIEVGQKHLPVSPRDMLHPNQIADDAAFIAFCANNRNEIAEALSTALGQQEVPPNKNSIAYVVLGGELQATNGTEFRDPSNIDVVGVYRNYDEAFSVWRGKAQSTVDNALMRYFVLPVGT